MYADRIEDDVDRVLSQIEAADKRRCRELVMLIDCPGGLSRMVFVRLYLLSRPDRRRCGRSLFQCGNACPGIMQGADCASHRGISNSLRRLL